MRLAQVPAAIGDVLYDQILHHIQTATRSEDGNRLQLVELTYAFCADEILQADPRGLERVLASIQLHSRTHGWPWPSALSSRASAVERQYPVHQTDLEIVQQHS